MENFSNTLISPGLESILKICQKTFQGAQPLAVVDHAQRKLLDILYVMPNSLKTTTDIGPLKKCLTER